MSSKPTDPFLVNRVATALAEWANAIRLNRMTDWSPHDFGNDAERFVTTLRASMDFHETLGHELTEESIKTDLTTYLQWSMTGEAGTMAARVALFEVGPDITGLEFDL